jgi:colanic acid biosynthesis glycosyl transferase WcaI
MKILIITNLYAPDRGGGASVFTDLAVGLREHGCDVTVFTTHPYYPEWKRRWSGSPWRVECENIDGVSVFRHGLYVPSDPSRLAPRLVYEASFGISLLRSIVRGGTFDVVMVYCPMLSAVGFAALRTTLRGEPLWLNVQDLPADAAAASGFGRSTVFRRVASLLQRFIFRRAQVWSTISPVMADRLRDLAGDHRPVLLHPNWLNGSIADEIDRTAGVADRVDTTEPRLLYAGNIGKKQGLLEFCQALAGTQLQFSFRICGDGSEADSVRSWVRASNDSRFSFEAFLDEPGFVAALRSTDLYVITEREGAGASFIPSKLIPSIACGTPVLAICDGDGPLGCEMARGQLGWVVPWTGLSAIGPILSEIQRDPAILEEYRSHCVNHSSMYRRSHAIDAFVNAFDLLSSTGSTSLSGSSLG